MIIQVIRVIFLSVVLFLVRRFLTAIFNKKLIHPKTSSKEKDDKDTFEAKFHKL